MPSLSFQKRFASAIISCAKTQTIRAQRKRPIKVGDKLYLFTGMRTKQCKRIKETVCIFSRYINIDRDGIVWADGQRVKSVDLFAQSDGFASFSDMLKWFENNHQLPFYGQVIRWEA